MAVRDRVIGTMVLDIAVRLREDGIAAATEGIAEETAVEIVLEIEAIAAATAVSRQAAARKVAVVRHNRPAAVQARSLNRSNSRRVRHTSVGPTGINHRQSKGRRAPKGTTKSHTFEA